MFTTTTLERPKKVVVIHRWSKNDLHSAWSLLTVGHCLKVVVKTGLTIFKKIIPINSWRNNEWNGQLFDDGFGSKCSQSLSTDELSNRESRQTNERTGKRTWQNTHYKKHHYCRAHEKNCDPVSKSLKIFFLIKDFASGKLRSWLFIPSPQTSNLKPQNSNLKPQNSNLKPQTSTPIILLRIESWERINVFKMLRVWWNVDIGLDLNRQKIETYLKFL